MHQTPMRGLLAILTLACAAIAVGPAHSQPYPNRPVRVVVPFPAGSALDATARIIGVKLADALGQPVLVDNRVGANGIIGADAVAKAKADGYTLLLTTPSTQVTSRFLMKSLPFDPRRDFTPVMAAVEPVTVLVAHPSLPASNVRELVELARRQPGKLSFGSSGTGSVFHLSGELLNTTAGIDLVHVPFKGTAPAVTALVGGQIPLALTALGDVLTYMQAGKLKLLAVLERTRYAGLKEVPSIAETLPAFEKPATWFGFFAPAGLPGPELQRLHGDIARVLQDKEAKARLESLGLHLLVNTPEQFDASIRSSSEHYERLIHAARLQPE